MTMDFKQATDELLAPFRHEKLAFALGVSVPSIRQARLKSSAKAYRKPPEGWEGALADLAEMESARLYRLSQTLNKTARKQQKALTH